MPPEIKVKKKSSAKSPSKRKAKTPPPVNRGGGNGPFYVLVIIILITVIVLLLNKFYEKGRFTFTFPEIAAVKSDKTKDKNENSKERILQEKSSVHSESEEKNIKNDDQIVKPDVEKPDNKISVPEKNIVVFFLKLDEKSDKIYLSTVKRKLPDNQLLSQALEQLIKGPTPYEQRKGYITAVPPNLKIRSIDIKGKIAEIDFDDVIESGAAGDILLKRIQQIVNTATQFDNVESIIIKINGQRRKTIGGDGFSIGGPLRR